MATINVCCLDSTETATSSPIECQECGSGWYEENGHWHPTSFTVIFHPTLSKEQVAEFLTVLGDLFEAAGGKGGLKVVR